MLTRAAVFVATLIAAGAIVQSSDRGTVLPIDGGTFEASGVVAIDGGVLFVDDGRPGDVFWMALDEAGRQTGPAQAIPLGVDIDDKEGITTDGTHIYVVGSQSKKGTDRGAGLARFTFDARAKQVGRLEWVSDLRTKILTALPEVARAVGRKADGFNIEGLAWDPANRRLLLGLRAPVIDGHALVIPLSLADPKRPLEESNVTVARDGVTRLPLGGGIRSIEYDPVSNDFRILSAGEGKGAEFSLWRWTGSGAPQREPLVAQVADRAAKAEGIARVGTGDDSYMFIVFDTSRYVAMR